jgi:hypothetical protein
MTPGSSQSTARFKRDGGCLLLSWHGDAVNYLGYFPREDEAKEALISREWNESARLFILPAVHVSLPGR